MTETASIVFDRSTFPTTRLHASTEPKVSVQANGQIQFNSFASKQLGDSTHLYGKADKNGKAHVITFVGRTKPTKDRTLEQMFEVRRGKGKAGANTGNAYFGAAGLCKMLEYDYQGSGTQQFDAEVAESKAGPTFTFTLPIGALEPRKVTPRKAKGAKGATATKPTEPSDEVGTEDAGDDDDELE